jgi:electron transfer flavoprotein alpha/beta subunit
MEPYKAWECRQGLAEMGALCRVEGAGGQLKTVEWIEAEYEPALLSVWQEIFRVRLVSLQASADQEKIRLSKTFLQDFAQAEMEKMRKVAVPANQSDRIQEEVEEAREVMAELDFRP